MKQIIQVDSFDTVNEVLAKTNGNIVSYNPIIVEYDTTTLQSKYAFGFKNALGDIDASIGFIGGEYDTDNDTYTYYNHLKDESITNEELNMYDDWINLYIIEIIIDVNFIDFITDDLSLYRLESKKISKLSNKDKEIDPIVFEFNQDYGIKFYSVCSSDDVYGDDIDYGIKGSLSLKSFANKLKDHCEFKNNSWIPNNMNSNDYYNKINQTIKNNELLRELHQEKVIAINKHGKDISKALTNVSKSIESGSKAQASAMIMSAEILADASNNVAIATHNARNKKQPIHIENNIQPIGDLDEI